MPFSYSFILSQRGTNVLVINDFKFNRKRVERSGLVKWVCGEKNCTAKCFTNSDGLLLRIEIVHNHIADVNKLARQSITNACKVLASSNIHEKPSQLINKELTNNQFSVHIHENDVRSVRKRIWEHRRKFMPLIQHSIDDVHETIDKGSYQTSIGENFMLDNDMGSTKIPYKVGFIGAGNMAKAIGNGILVSGTIQPKDLIISAPTDRNLGFWKEKGAVTTHDNAAVIAFADIVFIAVKPQYFSSMIDGLQQSSLSVNKEICFVSIMAGKTIESVTQILRTVKGISGPFEVIKVMPNTPSMVGAGCSVMATEKKGKFSSVVRQIMELTGVCEEIPESLMNACGALSGSGPAYLFMVVEALSDGGVKLGIPRDLSYKLAAQTMVGAGKMVLESGKHPGALKDEVCSPGGSTITAVHELEKSGVRAAFMNALAAATERSEQLGK